MCPPVIVRAGSGQAKAAFCHGPFYYFSFLPRAVLLLPLSSSRFFLLAGTRPRTAGATLDLCGKETPGPSCDSPLLALGDDLVCQFHLARDDRKDRETPIPRATRFDPRFHRFGV